MSKTMLTIMARMSMLSDLEYFLRNQGIVGYTILNHVAGKGRAGRVYETFLAPDENIVILAVLPSEGIEKPVNELKAMYSPGANSSRDQMYPLKVFSIPCTEHL